ncbi:MAG: ATP-dependent 6-phosphofructokinase [Promethearchaeota archaeon]
MKTIGVVTTGGDAPGMNAAIRAVVRLAYSKNFQVLGFMKGWEGVITNTFMPLDPRSVSGIIHIGGTMLQTSRCLEFREEEGRKKAAETLASNKVDGLIVIGGNGTMNGALALTKETDALVVGLPATIDNDVFGTDETIGFDTAVNTAVSEVDKIRDTAVSHDRIFIVEVMGRKRGFLALNVGIAVGAEVILIPEKAYTKEKIIKTIEENIAKGKKSGIIVAAEGVGDNHKLAKELEVKTGSEVRLSVLGYAQRGGNATARSRLLAGLFANKAIELLSNDQGNQVVGLQNGKITTIELTKSCITEKPLDFNLLKLANLLAT